MRLNRHAGVTIAGITLLLMAGAPPARSQEIKEALLAWERPVGTRVVALAVSPEVVGRRGEWDDLTVLAQQMRTAQSVYARGCRGGSATVRLSVSPAVCARRIARLMLRREMPTWRATAVKDRPWWMTAA